MTGINGSLGVLRTLAVVSRHIVIGRGITINRVVVPHRALGENAREDRKERIQQYASTVSPSFFPVLKSRKIFFDIPPALATPRNALGGRLPCRTIRDPNPALSSRPRRAGLRAWGM